MFNIFFKICLHLSAPLVLVIFCNHSIRKLVLQRSEGIVSTHFQHVLSTSFQVSFFIRFSWIFGAIVRSMRHPFSEKNGSENSFKKGAPQHETTPYEHVRGLPERPPRVRTCQTRNNSSSSKCCSSSFPLLFSQKNARKCCLSSLQLQMFQKNFETNVKDQCQEDIVHDLTRPWPKAWRICSLHVFYFHSF